MPNLEAFLRQHREDQDSPHLPIWIDAICINQTDFFERRKQVGMMWKLYTRLCRLVVWLGTEDKDSTFVIEALKLAAWTQEEGKESVWQVQKLLASKHYANNFNYTIPLTNFLMRSWFSRSWVVQEYALGTQSAIVFKCGRLQLGSDEMEALEALSPRNISSNGGPEILASDEYHRGILLWNNLRLAPATVLDPRKHNILLNWLSALRHKFATDPRGKVYATLGLAHSNGRNTHSRVYDPASLIIDYNASVQDVYSSLVKSVVISTKKLNVLLACNERTHHINRSWVPDWSGSHAYRRPGFMGYFYGSLSPDRNVFCSSGSEDADAIFASDLSTMTVRGLRLGKVSDTLDLPDPRLRREDFGEESNNHFLIPRMWLDRRACPSEGQFTQSLWQTCLMHMGPSKSDLLSRYDLLGLWFNDIIDPSTNTLRVDCSASHINLFTLQFMNKMALRRSEVLFTTDNGFIGKDFSQRVRIGDIICVLLGCPAPVALRRV